MGVYNPLVDMPVCCADCFTRGGSNCYLHNDMLYPNVLKHRHPDCPLVEVKAPHGRLIDRDALVADTSFFDGGDWHYGYSNKQIESAPTVLEAEEKDDG